MRRTGWMLLLLAVTAANGFAATTPKDSVAETPKPALAMSPLPLSTPLTPLPSGALTNFNAVQTNWLEIQNRLLGGNSSIPQRPWIQLERSRFGATDVWNEYYMHEWQKTPELIRKREQDRAALGPDGKPIKKP